MRLLTTRPNANQKEKKKEEDKQEKTVLSRAYGMKKKKVTIITSFFK